MIGSGSPERLEDGWAERTLRERARRYAQGSAMVEDGAKAEVLRFRLRDEVYAIELRLMRKVQLARGLTPVPCTPPHVAGILNIRGDVVAVLDLANMLGLDSPIAPSERSRVLVVELAEMRVGLLVDEVLGDHLVTMDKLDRALSGRDFARGVAEASFVFLNLEQLLSGGHFDVLEEV